MAAHNTLDLDDLTEKIEDCEQSRSMLSYFFSAKKKKKEKSVMPWCCHRPACLWGVLFKMATTTIVEDEEVEVDQL